MGEEEEGKRRREGERKRVGEGKEEYIVFWGEGSRERVRQRERQRENILIFHAGTDHAEFWCAGGK